MARRYTGDRARLESSRGAGLRFVTAECERIDADGTVSIGSLQTAIGLVSRRSEMLAAREQIRHYEQSAHTAVEELAALNVRLQEKTEHRKELDEAVRRANQGLAEFAFQQSAAVKRRDELALERDRLKREIDETREQLSASLVIVANAEVAAQAAIGEAQALAVMLLGHQDRLRQLEEERRITRESITSEKVVLARIEQRCESLQATLDQLNRDASERQNAVAEAIAAIAALDAKTAATEVSIHEAKAQGLELMERVNATQNQLTSLFEVTAQLQTERNQIARQRDQYQRQLDRASEQFRQLENEIASNVQRIEELITRYRQDYQLDLMDRRLVETSPELIDRGAAEAEVAQLRQDIASVGSVNMEALRELDELQGRYDTLHGHYQDLTAAKENLRQIVQKINEDSQRLFSDTLEIIRKNFQELYRRSFGGGHADLVLETCEDMSEAGVEIVATPPGKTALSNSLLSGGEKALTAVALIMAIFQFAQVPSVSSTKSMPRSMKRTSGDSWRC